MWRCTCSFATVCTTLLLAISVRVFGSRVPINKKKGEKEEKALSLISELLLALFREITQLLKLQLGCFYDLWFKKKTSNLLILSSKTKTIRQLERPSSSLVCNQHRWTSFSLTNSLFWFLRLNSCVLEYILIFIEHWCVKMFGILCERWSLCVL